VEIAHQNSASIGMKRNCHSDKLHPYNLNYKELVA
jgi:hypothetical protein